MFRRATTLCFAALTAAAALPGGAWADHRRMPPPPPPDYVDEYSGPPVLRYIPGVRILFGDYALTEDEYDQLYGQRRHRQFDESYYEPEPAPPPRAKRVTPPAKKPATAAKPAATQQKTASAAPAKPAAGGALSCEKATSVISGYGFSSVEAASCTGKSYAFNATRDGKKFAIRLDPASGELTEVKKLP